MNKEVYSRLGVDLFLRNGAVMRLGSRRSPSFYAQGKMVLPYSIAYGTLAVS